MAQAVIGALRVNLGIDSAAFDKGLKGAEAGLGKFGATVTKGLVALGAAATAAATAIAVAMRGVINEADNLGKMSQKIGIPVEELSRLKHAAELSGLSLDQMSTAVGRLSRNMADVAAGAGGTAARAFDQLGISVTNADGSLRSSTQVMAEMSDRFAAMPDGAEKTALAMQLMGRSGAEMIPMLNGGSEALRAMMAEADQLGIVISTRTAKAAEAFNDNMDRVRKAISGIVIQLTAEMLPHLERFSEALVDVAKNSDLLKSASESLTTFLKYVVDVAIQAAAAVRSITAEISGLGEAVSRMSSGDFSGAWDAFLAGQRESLRLFAEQKAMRDELWKTPQKPLVIGPNGPGGAAPDTGPGSSLGGNSSLPNVIRGRGSPIQQGGGLVQVGSQMVGVREPTPVHVIGGLSPRDIPESVRVGLNQSKVGSLDDIIMSAADMGVSATRAGIPYASKTVNGVIGLADDVRAFDANAVGAIGSSNKLLSGIHSHLTKGSLESSYTPTTGTSVFRYNPGGSLSPKSSSDWSDDFGADGMSSVKYTTDKDDTVPILKDGVTVSSSTLDVLRKSFTELQGIRSTLESRTMLVIPAGSVLPEGLDLPGFARGGSFTVGGSGGLDSKLAMMMLSPGERVDITPRGQDRGGAGGEVNVYNTYNVPVDNRPESINTQLLSWQIARSVQGGQQMSMRAGR